MASKLQRLLESIDPARTIDLTAARADAAVNSFRIDRGIITNWEEFRGLLVRFMLHVECGVLRLPSHVEMPFEFHWGRCLRPLERAYGSSSGPKAAYEMARTGSEGGLYGVLKAVAREISGEYAENEVSGRALSYWNSLSVDEQLAASTEYLAKYRDLLPGELTEGSAARIRGNFVKVLEQHPRMLQRLRMIGRA